MDSSLFGKFISLEGIDGAGKSSHVNWIRDYLEEKGVECICTREPGGTPLGETLRKILLSTPMDINAEVLLMFASRAQHVKDVIKPALERGAFVLSDRFSDSSFAFQGARGIISIDKLVEIEKWVLGSFSPDLTFLFDLPTEVAANRISKDRDLDIFEKERADYHARVKDIYLKIAKNEPSRVIVIDAEKSIEDIRLDLAICLDRLIQDSPYSVT